MASDPRPVRADTARTSSSFTWASPPPGQTTSAPRNRGATVCRGTHAPAVPLHRDHGGGGTALPVPLLIPGQDPAAPPLQSEDHPDLPRPLHLGQGAGQLLLKGLQLNSSCTWPAGSSSGARPSPPVGSNSRRHRPPAPAEPSDSSPRPLPLPGQFGPLLLHGVSSPLLIDLSLLRDSQLRQYPGHRRPLPWERTPATSTRTGRYRPSSPRLTGHPDRAGQPLLRRLVHNICGVLLLYDRSYPPIHLFSQCLLPAVQTGKVLLQPPLPRPQVQPDHGGQGGDGQHQPAGQPAHLPDGPRGIRASARAHSRLTASRDSSHIRAPSITTPPP